MGTDRLRPDHADGRRQRHERQPVAEHHADVRGVAPGLVFLRQPPAGICARLCLRCCGRDAVALDLDNSTTRKISSSSGMMLTCRLYRQGNIVTLMGLSVLLLRDTSRIAHGLVRGRSLGCS